MSAKIVTKEWVSPSKQKYHVVGLTLDGDPIEYMFRYDFNRICDLEAETGLNLGVMVFQQMTSTQTRALVCAFLRTAHAVTLEEAGDLISEDYNNVIAAVMTALRLAKIMDDDPEQKPADKSVTEPAADAVTV